MAVFAARWLAGATLIVAAVPALHAQPEVGMNEFACSLYAELGAEQENLFFSPFSIATALAMSAEGAHGETAREMGTLLGLPAALQRDATQPQYDWSPLHQRLGALADALAPKPPSLGTARRIATLHEQLARANATLERATSYDQAYYSLGEEARRLADELNSLQKQIDPTEFRSANALWLERSFALEPPYLDAIARHYRSGGAMPLDFRGDPEGSRARINAWVAEQTRDRIQDLLQPGNVDASTRLVLTNAVYFLGEWLEPFDAARTRREPFALREGGRVEVALMRAFKKDGVRYAAFNADGSAFDTPLRVPAGESDASGRYPSDGFQLVELPYRGGALSMQVLLPLRADGLPALEALLRGDALARWSAALATRNVDVALPKFKLEMRAELARMLQQLGMRRAFVNPAQPDGAQFDGMSASTDPTRRLYIGAVIHQAFVQVDEKGTEAAAATAVSMLAGAAMPTMVDFTPVFRADRPFVFLIRDTRSGAVLFLGRLARPDAA
jgi:serpin B